MRPPSLLLLSADDDGDIRRKAFAAGAKDFITKPFDATELLRRLAALING